MNELVKTSIEARKKAIYNGYKIQDEGLKNKIEELFKRIMEFGEGCKDAGDFEAKFANSPLNQEYIDIFTKVATTCEQIQYDTTPTSPVKSDEEIAKEEVASEIRYQAKEATMPIRRAVRQETYDQARDIPIIGNILSVKQHIDFFSRFKKKDKKENKNEEKK